MAPHHLIVEDSQVDDLCVQCSRQESEDIGEVEKIVINPEGMVAAEPDLLDAVDGGVNFKCMAWWHVGMLMIAETVSLGILSLPSAVARLGLIPGLLLIPTLGALATYSGYVIGQFKLAHPSVHSFAGAGEILFGPIGREVFGIAAILSFIFVQAAHILTFSVMMNVLTEHASCSILWGAIATAISIVLTMPRTLKKVSYISVIAFVSISAAVMVVMINVSVTNEGGKNIDYFATDTTFAPVFVGYLDIMLAYSGNAAFFGFISELKQPKAYPKALFLLQGTAVTFYTTVAAVIYYYVGRDVDSPALGAATPLVRKIAYGIALPTIVVAGVINGHVAAMMVNIKLWTALKQPKNVGAKTFKAYATWAGIVTAMWVTAWILAEAIPIFNELLGLMSALFMSWFTFGISGMMWFHLNRKRWHKSARKLALSVLNTCLIIIALGSCILGLYASGKEIAKVSSASEAGKAFSCANNDPKAAGH